jgi:chromosomal replication initiator protein
MVHRDRARGSLFISATLGHGACVVTHEAKEFPVTRLALDEPRSGSLDRLHHVLLSKIGNQRYDVWFRRSAKFDIRNDSLEINVPNDFIGEWIDTHFARPIQEATHEVFGTALPVRFNVVPQLFEARDQHGQPGDAYSSNPHATLNGSHTTVASNAQVVAAPKPLLGASVHAEARVDSKRSEGRGAESRRDVGGGHRGAMASVVSGIPSGLNTRQPAIGIPAVRSARGAHVGQGQHGTGHAASSTAASAYQGQGSGQVSSLVAGRVVGSHAVSPGPIESTGPIVGEPASMHLARARLRHDLSDYVIGTPNQLAHSTVNYVCEFPGGQYNPLFLHGTCGLGKSHLLQGLCKRFSELHPTKRWMYLTGEEFTNEYITAVRQNRVDHFRRRMRDLDLLVIDDVHFLAGKRSTQEEFLHTFNAIEATGRQVVMASDAHPKHITEFTESLINRFISGMVVRIDAPNYAMRCEILKRMAARRRLILSEEVVDWIAKRVTQNVREIEGALTRVQALSRLDGRAPGLDTVAEALGDLDRQMVAPLRPENILASVCQYFGLEHKELLSGRRQRTISLARSVAMFLVRKNSRLSFPEIAGKLGKRNHSTVISACRRIERALARSERLAWESSTGDRCDEASELVQRLEESARAMAVG